MNRGILTQAAIPAAMPYGLLGRPRPVPLPDRPYAYDTDAADYISRVEAADGQELELQVKVAIDAFVRGCKDDGTWNAIKASCVLAGARTLSGALVPLAGAAPTNFNFVSSDYNRRTGLAGNGTTKYLNSNRKAEDQGQNNVHVSAYVTSTLFRMGRGGGDVGAATLGETGTRLRNQTALNFASSSILPCFIGGTRSGTLVAGRNRPSSTTIAQASETTLTGNILIYALLIGTSSVELYATGRCAFYSIGEALDLALLDARVTTLINAIGAAL